MRLLVVVILVLPTVVPASAGPLDPRTVTDASVTAASLFLTEADLAAGTKSLPAGGTHTVTARVEDAGLLGIDVRLEWGIGGAPPSGPGKPMAPTGPESGGFVPYAADLTPSDYAGPPEHVLSLRIIVTYRGEETTYPASGSWSYTVDGAAPQIHAFTVNSAATYTGTPTDPVTLRADHDDASGVSTARFELFDDVGASVASFTPPPGTAFTEKAFPSGTGLGRGVYDARVTLTDAHGHVSSSHLDAALRISSGPPGVVGSEAEVPGAVLDEDDLVASRFVRGDGDVKLRLTMDDPLAGEAVAVEVHHTFDGTLPGSSSPSESMLLLDDAGATRTYQHVWPRDDLAAYGGEHPVRYRFHVQSDDYGSTWHPASGALAFYWDDAAPRIDALHLNGEDRILVRADEPLLLAIEAHDAGGIATARAEIRDGAEVLRDVALHPSGATLQAHVTAGLGLQDGEYDVRVVVEDAVGHASTLTRTAAIRVDATAPGVQELRLNGERVLQTPADRALTVEAVVDAGDAEEVTVEFLDGHGATAKSVDLQRGATAWKAFLGGGVLLPDGFYDAAIRVVDSAGNERVHEAGYAPLVVDSTPPVLTPLGASYPRGQEAARPGDAVGLAVRVDGDAVQGVLAELGGERRVMKGEAGTGLFSITWNAPPQSAIVVVHAEDHVGNAAATEVQISVDGTPPRAASTGVEYARGTTAAPGDWVSLRIVALDDETRVRQVTIDASAVNAHAGTVEAYKDAEGDLWTARVMVLAGAGTHALPVRIVDAAGNVAEDAIAVVVRDAGPQVLAWSIDGTNRLVLDASRSIRFGMTVASDGVLAARQLSILDAAGTVAAMRDFPESASGEHLITFDPGLGDGAYRLRFVAVDAQGRMANTTTAPVLIVDGEAPRIESFHIDTGYNAGLRVPQGFFQEPIAFVADVQDTTLHQVLVHVVSANGLTYELELLPDGDRFVARMPFRENGAFEATLHAEDEAGRSTTAQAAFKVVPRGGQAPGAVMDLRRTSADTDRTVTFQWTPPTHGHPILGYAVALDQDPVEALSTTATTWTSEGPLALGDHVLHVAAVNDAGNWGPVTTHQFFVGHTVTDLQQEARGSGSLRLVAQPLPAFAKQGPALTWSAEGSPADLAALDCVEVQVRVRGEWSVLEPCDRDGSTNALQELSSNESERVSVRARIHYVDGPPDVWIDWGSLAIDHEPPRLIMAHAPANVTGNSLSIGYEAREANPGAFRLELIRDGAVERTLALPGPGNQSIYVDGLASGAWTTRFVLEDAAANRATYPGPAFTVDDDTTQSEDGADNTVAVIVAGITLVALLATAIVLVARRHPMQGESTDEAGPISRDAEPGDVVEL